MPKVIIEGQEINLTAEQSATDEMIKNLLLPYYPAIAFSEVKRETVHGEEVIKIAKSVGTKGSPLESLIHAPEEVHPALIFAWQLKQKQIQGDLSLEEVFRLNQQLEAAIYSADQQYHEINDIIKNLVQAQAQPSLVTILGF